MNGEILIVGGGVIGLSIARELHRKGAGQITLVDRGDIGSESSWAAAGMLAPNIETDTTEDFYRFGCESLARYPDLADSLLAETGVDIELDRSGTLCLAFDEAEESGLDETYARQKARGVEVERISDSRIREIEPAISPAARAGLFYPNDWQVENRKLLTALLKYCEMNGIRIVPNAEVMNVTTGDGKFVSATTPAGDISGDVAVIATGAWTSLIKIDDAPMPVPVKPIRGQMISFENAKLLHRVTYSARGYLVPRVDGRLLVGATVEDVGFEKAITDEGVNELTSAAVEIIPKLAALPIAERWCGLRPFASDGLPVIGEVPGYENVFVATAHYRNGILLAPRTAEILADRIVDGTRSELLELYGVRRLAVAANANRQSII